jgi:hypothetical protein
MSISAAAYRRIEAAQRREERAAQKRRREIERQLKEMAKLSALEQARLEVETYENAIDVLLSVHKEQSPSMDWASLASGLPPHPPARFPRNELAAHFKAALASISLPPKNLLDRHGQVDPANSQLAALRTLDDRAHDAACAAYLAEYEEWLKERALAQRVLKGETRAYTEALAELSPFTNIESLGSSINMIVHNSKAISCELKVNPLGVVPKEVKTLTSTGKLSIKAMPKARAHEIYQDHVCTCALRLCREMFVFLPVDIVIVTAFVDGIDSRSGNPADVPILSVQMVRKDLSRLDFSRLDPSDAVESLPHRGDVKASRRTGQFAEVEPLTPDEINSAPQDMSFVSLLDRLREVRQEVRRALNPESAPKATADVAVS